jgi:type II secretory ATPase GspE/PulE/Tfp pilus assembly ATPase PilB-like protein
LGVDKEFVNFLLSKNVVNEEEVKKALEIQKKYKSQIGTILLNSGVITEKDYIKVLSEYLNIPLFSENEEKLINKVELSVPVESLIQKNIFPFFEDENNIYIAVNYNFKYDELLKLRNFLDKEIKLYLALEEQIQQIKELYLEEETNEDLIDLDESDEVEKLKELASEAPVIKLINTHLNKAVEYNASDIHYEAFKKGMKVRFRIDGVLRVFDTIPVTYKKAAIARLKLLSKMNIAENRLPQDGRISLKIANQEIDVRASSVPTAFGESFVLRLLGKQSISYELESLEFYSDQMNILRKIVSKPNGIFLTTGPTGSGKTTTLYSLLNELNSDEVKIITVEDPVEYELEGISQIQVKPQIDFTFANALRSILRQDPDIIMIGEIRDVETANIAIQSALTGHFVLSTLHTNSALGAITRLLDMGVDMFLLKASIKGLMAQRLVRKLCPYCKKRANLDSNIRKYLQIDEILKKYPFVQENIYEAVGCEKCAHTGYKGRLPVAEIIEFNEDVQRAIEKDRNITDVSTFGYRNLKEDAILKFLEGKTTYEEIMKVIS